MSDNGEISRESSLFYQIVLTFHTAAWQQLGKILNPFTGKTEVNLEAASLSIDMLDALRSKTKGNLNPNEDKFLERVLSDLKLNYIDELKRAKSSDDQQQGDEPASEAKSSDAASEEAE